MKLPIHLSDVYMYVSVVIYTCIYLWTLSFRMQLQKPETLNPRPYISLSL